MTARHFILFTAAAVLFCGCEDRYTGHDYKGTEMSVTVKVQDYDGNSQDNFWSDGDRIGVSLEGMTDFNSDTNIAFDFDSATGEFIPVNDPIILKGTDRTLMAYYPFIGAENVEPSEISIITGDGDPVSVYTVGNEEQEGDGDCLFATAVATKENPTAAFDFKHVLSRLHFDFAVDIQGAEAGPVDFTMSGLYLVGRFNPYTGEIQVNDAEGTSSVSVRNIQNMALDLILVPQTSPVTVTLVYNNRTYVTEIELSLASGMVQNYTATISEDTLDAVLTVEDDGAAEWEVENNEISSGNN